MADLRDWIFGLGPEGVLREMHNYCLDERDKALNTGEDAQLKYSGLCASEIAKCIHAIRVKDGQPPLLQNCRGELREPIIS